MIIVIIIKYNNNHNHNNNHSNKVLTFLRIFQSLAWGVVCWRPREPPAFKRGRLPSWPMTGLCKGGRPWMVLAALSSLPPLRGIPICGQATIRRMT